MAGERAETAAERNLRLLATERTRQLGTRAELLDSLKATYLESARDERFDELLRECILALSTRLDSGSREEAKGILVLGGTGAGKSRMVSRDVGRHPLFGDFMRAERECAAVGVRCKGVDTLGILAAHIMRATGYPILKLGQSEAWTQVRDRLEHLGVLLLWIDEVHSLLAKVNSRDLKTVLTTFKGLLNDERWPVILVLSGTPECEAYLQQNWELRRRLKTMTLDPMLGEDWGVLADHLATLAAKAGLALDKDATREIVPRLAHAAHHEFGNAVDLTLAAIAQALTAGSPSLGRQHFILAYQEATQAEPAANPFAAKAWEKVVVRHVASTDDPGAWNAAAASAAKSRTRVGIA